MKIPGFQKFMLPILNMFKDGQTHSASECRKEIIKIFNFTAEELSEKTPSGQQSIIYNRISWCFTYLKFAELIESIERGVYRITQRGLDLLEENIPEITIKLLKQYDEFNEARNGKNKEIIKDEIAEDDETPIDKIETIVEELNKQLADELLNVILEKDWVYFESFVGRFLISLGYGDGTIKSFKLTPKTGDGGVDGIINQDKLGLDKILIQAKHYKIGNDVGSREIRNFSGAMRKAQINKGIFITTSNYKKEAIEEAKGQNIVLINGKELAQYMINNNIGVQTVNKYEIKKIDYDYFDNII